LDYVAKSCWTGPPCSTGWLTQVPLKVNESLLHVRATLRCCHSPHVPDDINLPPLAFEFSFPPLEECHANCPQTSLSLSLF